MSVLLLILAGACGSPHVIHRRSAPDSVAYFCPMDTLVNRPESGVCEVCGMKLARNPLYKDETPDIKITTTGDTLYR